MIKIGNKSRYICLKIITHLQSHIAKVPNLVQILVAILCVSDLYMILKNKRELSRFVFVFDTELEFRFGVISKKNDYLKFTNLCLPDHIGTLKLKYSYIKGKYCIP